MENKPKNLRAIRAQEIQLAKANEKAEYHRAQLEYWEAIAKSTENTINLLKGGK